MLVRESDDGGIYWQCINKDYSRSADQPYPKDGILRCHCGAEYAFAMKKEPRWVCTANSRHYQKMRESDLKLEKMRALIPKKELKAVEKYFDSYRKEHGLEKRAEAPAIQNQMSIFDDGPAQDLLREKGSTARKILQMDDAGAVLREYESIASASRETGINTKSIREAAKGAQKHAGGFCWSYKNK